MKRTGFVLLSLLLSSLSFGQKADTTYTQDSLRHSPSKATFMSLAVPGLGQVYNKKYWKVPLVYALIGTPLYFALEQRRQFNEFKEVYLARVDDDPNTVDTKYIDVYSDENVLSLIDFHRENRDLLFVLTGVAYIINVVDAAVDAHLFYFEVNDDLSAELRPNVQYAQFQRSFVPSMTLSLKFGKNNRRNNTLTNSVIF